MFSAVSIIALLLLASSINAQANPITDLASQIWFQILRRNWVGLFSSNYFSDAAATLINAAQPFNCEITVTFFFFSSSYYSAYDNYCLASFECGGACTELWSRGSGIPPLLNNKHRSMCICSYFQQYLANPAGAGQDLIGRYFKYPINEAVAGKYWWNWEELNNPVHSASITTYATQLASWPLCWAAEVRFYHSYVWGWERLRISKYCTKNAERLLSIK